MFGGTLCDIQLFGSTLCTIQGGSLKESVEEQCWAPVPVRGAVPVRLEGSVVPPSKGSRPGGDAVPPQRSGRLALCRAECGQQIWHGADCGQHCTKRTVSGAG